MAVVSDGSYAAARVTNSYDAVDDTRIESDPGIM